MFGSLKSAYFMGAALIQRLTTFAIGIIALGLIGVSIAAAFSFLPWLSLPVSFGDAPPFDAGMWVQLGFTALFIGLATYLPTNRRIMALENSHRRFHIGMQDVSHAYAMCHAADRTGHFRLKSEFDSVRERIAFLRDHPDLSELEPSVLEVAAQMSHVSRDLAHTYSDEAIDRARDFLIQRQDEIEQFNGRLDQAKGVAAEIRQWIDRIEVEESVMQSQANRLAEEMRGLLPELFPQDPEPEAQMAFTLTNVTPLNRDAAE